MRLHLDRDFLDRLRQHVSIKEIIGRDVQWDTRKSNTAKGEYWACCPFHSEKSPSFKIDETLGRYYCFGCQQKGDVISYLTDHDQLSFVDAVSSLAEKAGMAMPEQAMQKGPRFDDLYKACELAMQFFQAELKGSAAKHARIYLVRSRGLDPDVAAHFSIGYAPSSGRALVEYLVGKSISLEVAEKAGLIAQRKHGDGYYDRFRDRVMFPIHDFRGRVVAFGGRLISGEGPKYINSTETPIFHKKNVLYNLHRARSVAREKMPILVVEGYMDCVALHRAGFPRVVAPMGTAIGDEHLQALWKLVPKPIICLDGDRAGQAAAERLVNLAIPSIGVDRTLSFLVLPSGQDPDDFLRENGSSAFAALIENAQSLASFLWDLELQKEALETPEAIAGLRHRLRQRVQSIPKSLRNDYAKFFHERLLSHDLLPVNQPAGKYVETPQKRKPPPVIIGREDCLMGMLILRPDCFQGFEEEIAELPIFTEGAQRLKNEILSWLMAVNFDDPLDGGALAGHLKALGHVHAVQTAQASAKGLISGIETLEPVDVHAHWNVIATRQRKHALSKRLEELRAEFTKAPSEDILEKIKHVRADMALLDGEDRPMA